MLIPSRKPRHTVEKFDNLVRVTVPSKRDIIRILWFFIWMFMWGYMVYGFILITVASEKSIEIGKNSIPPVQPGGIFFYLSICFSFFFLALLALGTFAIHRFIWVFTGKEIIEATPQVLTITKQAFGWQKQKNIRPKGSAA